jgi:hypothetical protein
MKEKEGWSIVLPRDILHTGGIPSLDNTISTSRNYTNDPWNRPELHMHRSRAPQLTMQGYHVFQDSDTSGRLTNVARRQGGSYVHVNGIQVLWVAKKSYNGRRCLRRAKSYRCRET